MWMIDIFAGFFAAMLSAMGVGGGGLLVIYLTEILGMEQRCAQGINLLFFLYFPKLLLFPSFFYPFFKPNFLKNLH